MSPTGSALVLQHKDEGGRTLEVVSLADGVSTYRPTRTGTLDVKQSCGTVIVREQADESKTYQVRDVLTDKLLSKSPYREFACSIDQEAVIGVTGTPARLMAGLTPPEEIKVIEHDNLVGFAISPDGKYLAYTTPDMGFNLCIRTYSRGAQFCKDVGTYPFGSLSINEAGHLLYTMSDDRCWYGNSLRSKANDCFEVREWRPGLEKAAKVTLGVYPVWLSDVQATALIRFARESKNSSNRKSEQ